ncbi:hypothetical protein [Pisciglobus halotolerans]|uniref:Uncharacterized protein n=1 Tax=Pisciglobus halotolerans TaxID=745365 RepID=A0A1I3CH54_9LACT|nr:hypothetical protein [Pisciglobus halotolerans]SFH73686.1 hypothetical protein SAMN04489868_11814 [Pisciglobus halotolerans]
MSIEWLIGLLIGGGGATGLLSAFFTRKSAKEKREIDLLDRAFKEIERLDVRIKELEAALAKKNGENEKFKMIIDGLTEDKLNHKKDIKKLKGD